ncbi:HK97 family phage prohead protease [Roseibium polysiphoniae]|uniref:HK97 family phage prohead protease n=1 Tax=Roseibium polysiphoniae TaxID=2571221 RepID=A0A944GRQ8_9HYPH|nr:HK97 family phage prohead protease [Roseibium polysiphoniae]
MRQAPHQLVITGYASLFGQRDGAGDLVRRGAFARSLARRRASGVAMLWQHDPAKPIGVWTNLAEDARGLRVTGRLLPDVALSREAAALVAAGALSGLSIGFRALKTAGGVGRRAGQPTRTLVEIDLWEVSLVTFPQVEGARLRLLPSSSHPIPSRRPQ